MGVPAGASVEPAGTVYSWTRTWYAFDRTRERAGDVPYVVVLVEVDGTDGARVLGVLAGDEATLKIGARVAGHDPPAVGEGPGLPVDRLVARMRSPLRGTTAVVGIGQTPLYKRGTSPEPELKLCLRAIVAACEDAGISPRDVDGFVSYGSERNAGQKLMPALGHPGAALRGPRLEPRRRHPRRARPGRGGHRHRAGRGRGRLPVAGRERRRPAAGGRRPGRHRRPVPGQRGGRAGPDLRPAHPADAGGRRRPGVDDARHGPGVLPPRPAQPRGRRLRQAVRRRDLRAVPVRRRAVPALRLLPGERRRRGGAS